MVLRELTTFLPIMGACCFGGIGSSETSTRVFILLSNGRSSLVSPQLSRQSRQWDRRIPDLIPYELGGTVDPVPASDGIRYRLEHPADWLGRHREPTLRVTHVFRCFGSSHLTLV
jgi:hypothetical protein